MTKNPDVFEKLAGAKRELAKSNKQVEDLDTKTEEWRQAHIAAVDARDAIARAHEVSMQQLASGKITDKEQREAYQRLSAAQQEVMLLASRIESAEDLRSELQRKLSYELTVSVQDLERAAWAAVKQQLADELEKVKKGSLGKLLGDLFHAQWRSLGFYPDRNIFFGDLFDFVTTQDSAEKDRDLRGRFFKE